MKGGTVEGSPWSIMIFMQTLHELNAKRVCVICFQSPRKLIKVHFYFIMKEQKQAPNCLCFRSSKSPPAEAPATNFTDFDKCAFSR